MESIEISRSTLLQMMYQAVVRAAIDLPKDVEGSLREALDRQDDPLAKLHLDLTLANVASARESESLACGDTGFPLYYVIVGEHVHVQGGLSILCEVSREAVRQATERFQLRSTMVHPLTRHNTGTNCGYYVPSVEVRFDPRFEGMKIVAVLKGGGAEIYGSYFKMMLAADGREGATKFILDSIKAGTEEGKTCPPSVVGVGIGGTSDICMKMAKEAAVLRPIGHRHPEKEIAEYERNLMDAVNSLGIGPMGTGGSPTVLAVNVEYAVVHTGALPVGVNIQCAIARRCVAQLNGSGELSFGDAIDWDYR
jgi:fumarate hydratase subunit alpha/L(+)-tartrate dehydratase alpha subunit